MSGAIHAVTVPKWGIEMQEGTLVAWRAAEGERVEKGVEIADLETEKIVNALEAPAGGILRRRLAQEGDTLSVGTLIAVLADADTAEAAIDAFIADFEPADASFDQPAGAESDAAATPIATPASGSESAAAGPVRVSPVVRRLAERLGVDLATVQGTGSSGRITKLDVERAASGGGAAEPAATTASAEYETQPLTSMRQTIARRLQASKRDVPHYYLGVDIETDALLGARRQLNADRSDDARISVNDLIVRAVALALIEVPALNVRLVDDELRRYAHAHVAIAVATDAGLITPVIRNADEKSTAEIATASRELAASARSGQLERSQIEDGTFTVSNLGMYGIKRYTAIINPPQGAILAVGAAEPRVVVRDGAAAVATMMSLTLACDHRIIDGAVGAQYLRALKALLEHPERL
jgi:pyruvate dehydrogenase E2 component (dihydrolipoamide acetyltransferase)